MSKIFRVLGCIAGVAAITSAFVFAFKKKR